LLEPTPQVRNRYDAIVVCEVLEHLQNPLQSLKTLSQCLKDDGKMFLTMAINIAQEDHVFLYPDPLSCRNQIRESGLRVVKEWLSPQSIRFFPSNREIGFKKGNYMAIVEQNTQVSDSLRTTG